MSFLDLKKTSNRSKKRDFSIEEFISDSENYAKGTPQLVSAEHRGNEAEVAAAIKGAGKKAKKKSEFRRVTFTLTEKAITQLTELSQQTGIPKSKLIRILVDDFVHKSQNDQEDKLHQTDVA